MPIWQNGSNNSNNGASNLNFENNTPITISWNVNAWAKNQKSLIKRVKNFIRPKVEDQDQIFNPLYNPATDLPGYKQILTNGII